MESSQLLLPQEQGSMSLILDKLESRLYGCVDKIRTDYAEGDSVPTCMDGSGKEPVG
jgi:hypothetical protein